MMSASAMGGAVSGRAVSGGLAGSSTNTRPRLRTPVTPQTPSHYCKLRTWSDSVSGGSLRPFLPRGGQIPLPSTPPKKIVCFRRSAKRRKRENEAKMKIVVAEQRAKRAAEAAAAKEEEMRRRLTPPKPKGPPIERKLSDLARVATDHILAVDSEGGEIDGACALFEETVDLLGWEGVVKELAVQDRLDLALGVFHWLERHPLLAPPDRVRSSVINLAGRAGRLDVGFELLEGAQGTPGIECFVALAKVCARVGTIEQVLALFKKMGEAGLDVRVESYNQVLEELVVARAPLLHCLRLFAYMQQENVPPKRLTYTMLVTACHSGGSIKDAYSIFEGLEAARWDPDIKAFNALFYICIVYRDFKEARRVLWRMRESKRIKLNPKSYELVIRLCKDSGWGLRDVLGPGYWDDVLKVYNEMRTGLRWPTVEIYQELLVLMGSYNNYTLAAQYYKDLREGAGLEATPGIHDALVNVDYRGEPQNPVRLLEAFRGLRYLPDLDFFEGMMRAYARVGAWQEAWLLLTVMPANGHTPSDEMFEIVGWLLTGAGCDLAEQVRGVMEELRAKIEQGVDIGDGFGRGNGLSTSGGRVDGSDGEEDGLGLGDGLGLRADFSGANGLAGMVTDRDNHASHGAGSVSVQEDRFEEETMEHKAIGQECSSSDRRRIVNGEVAFVGDTERSIGLRSNGILEMNAGALKEGDQVMIQ